jgi:hypothetical protein
MMRVPDSLLAAFPPSADLLLDCARRKTDDAMLMDIARADYGYRADEMMAALRPIRDTGVVPLILKTGEVLNLTHLSTLEAPDGTPIEPGPTGLHGHQARLFACAVLLHFEAERPHELRHVTNSALARCLISANVLGEEMSAAAACYLTWRMSRQEGESNRIFIYEQSLLCAFGLLVLATRLRSGRFAEPGLGAIAYWVLTIEWLGREEWLAGYPPTLAGPMSLPESVRAGFWQPLVAELKKGAESIRDDDARTNLQLCGILMDPGPRRRRR